MTFTTIEQYEGNHRTCAEPQSRIAELRQTCSDLKAEIKSSEPESCKLVESLIDDLADANDERDTLEKELDRLKQLKSAIDRYE